MIRELEELVRAGRFREAEKKLAELAPRALARKDALPLANIARRTGQFRWALAALNPIVRPAAAGVVPTEDEKIEYAELLRQLGAQNEALQILSDVDQDRYPEALILSAFCHFSKWDYEAAIPLLKKSLACGNLPEYRAWVARLNLAAALMQTNRVEEADRLLEEIEIAARNASMTLLFGNAMELQAQRAIALGDFARAKERLDLADDALKDVTSPHALFVRKWRAIAESAETGAPSPLLASVREEALTSRHWETAREYDFHSAKISGDFARLAFVYFGTPFDAYRLRIAREVPSGRRMPDRFTWTGFEIAESATAIVDVEAGAARGSSLAYGQATHRLLIALTRDFYRPLPTLALFGAVFPDEHFNPVSTPNRVHQCVRKLREWCAQLGANVGLDEFDGQYVLRPSPQAGLATPRETLPLDKQSLSNLKLWKIFEDRPLASARDVADALETSLASAKRLLLAAVETGNLERVGNGPATRYRVASRKNEAA